MGLLDLFKKKPLPSDGELWFAVATKISSMFAHLMQTRPAMLANPYARVVLMDDWNVHVATDKCDPRQILGPHDVAFVFLREDQAALSAWVNKLRDPDPLFAQMATEEYAKTLVQSLMKNVKIAG